MTESKIIKILTDNKLKVTPQRTAVLEVLFELTNHPTAEQIFEMLKNKIPHINLGTIYNILDTFVEKGILVRVKTDSGYMRYDAVKEKHHHLYSVNSGRIEDYFDGDLDMIIEEYLRNKRIPNFKISDFKLHISGTFTDKKT